MLRTSPFIKGIALATSAIAHAAAFVISSGHGAERGSAIVDPTVEVTIDATQPTATPDLPLPPAPANPRHAATRPRTHARPDEASSGHDGAPRDPSFSPVSPPPPQAPASESVPPPTAPTHVAPVRFALVVGGTATATPGGANARGDGPGDGEALVVDRPDAPARLLNGAMPAYPAEARVQGIESDVKLEIVVGASGRVEMARLLRGAGFGFDEAALAAIRNYRFAPATVDGRAVRARMNWLVSFRLQ
jgi:protein TonB